MILIRRWEGGRRAISCLYTIKNIDNMCPYHGLSSSVSARRLGRYIPTKVRSSIRQYFELKQICRSWREKTVMLMGDKNQRDNTVMLYSYSDSSLWGSRSSGKKKPIPRLCLMGLQSVTGWWWLWVKEKGLALAMVFGSSWGGWLKAWLVG